MYRARYCLVAIVALLIGLVAGQSGTSAQVRPKYSTGAPGLIQLLQRLGTTASALHTGAHPDDEDSALIARLARGDHARVSYVTLTRGDGGQNVIGPELFEGLGVIRTEELLQARRLDGGDQLFTRAFDFGFSKTQVETAQKWGEEAVLADLVRAIRQYRPFVVISRFSGTPQDGHGHHQFAGHITPIAYRQAGDPNRFPEHMAEGLRPWQPLKLYVSEGFRPGPSDEGVLRLPTGVLNRPLGRSYFEIAMEGRSQHKSQEMGMLELRGPQSSGLRLIESNVNKAAAGETHIFDGIDTSLTGIARTAGISAGVIDEALGRAQSAAERALADFDPLVPEAIVPILAEGLKAIRQARESVKGASSLNDDARYEADFLLKRKEEEFSEALRSAAGIVVDALADTDIIAPGERTRVEVRVFHPENAPVEVSGIELLVPEGWHVETTDQPAPRTGGRRFFTEQAGKQAFFLVNVPSGAAFTQPYWLREKRKGDLFVWPEGTPKGLPFGPAAADAKVSLKVGGEPVTAEASIQYRYADPARGEIRRELNVVPAITVSLESNLLIVPTSKEPRTERVVVRVESHSVEAVSGAVRLELPSGWTSVPAEGAFDLERKGDGTAQVFQVEIPGGTSKGDYSIGVAATSGLNTYELEMNRVSYPHIQTHRFYRPAELTVQVLDLEVADLRIGYIMGSGDRVPAAIQRMGLDVTLLVEEDLATGDLSRFDTIVVGIRASQVRPDFVANNGRILDFVRDGGALIVQYQRSDYVTRNLAPFPAQMNRPEHYSNHRVTDETAAVKVLVPDHSVFNYPNRISKQDWDGWVQERSLYHLTDLDSSYQPLLEAADPGEDPHNGGMVYAEVGKGRYVYSGYSFFRQLPAGVPGAYRLFANLLSLSKAP